MIQKAKGLLTQMYSIIREHFFNHFCDESLPKIKPFLGTPRKLKNEITTKEVTQSINHMSNNRAAGHDRVSVEMIKYAPSQIHTEISKILNNVFECHTEIIEINKGILVPLPKPKKTKGPVTHLRPINLLTVIRKILSNIALNRMKPKIDNHISQSQSAYRTGRSTTDIIWAHRWIIAKTQIVKIKVFITGIDMSSAFDTIHRDKLLKIVETFLDDDEIRIIRVLLSNTILQIKTTNGVKCEPFISTVGSPQGDGISGMLFNIYFESALRKIRAKLVTTNLGIEHNYYLRPNDHDLPNEMVYADDADFLTENECRKNLLENIVTDTLAEDNLNVNDTKTENTEIQRGDRNTEMWRHVRKLGSLLGDVEDIANRKQLAIVAMKDMNKIWLRRKKVSEQRRLKLYKSIVKPVLTYNSSTWGLRKSDEKALDSFHRQQLRRVLKIKFPHRISCAKLYKRCKEIPITLEILKARWRIFGHTLRLHKDTLARKAMSYHFDSHNLPRFRGGPRETIVRTLNRDIKRAKNIDNNFPLNELKTKNELVNAQSVAEDRETWRKITKTIFDVAQAENPFMASTR